MKKSKVSLVNFKAKNNPMGLFNLAPLGLTYLGTVLDKKGYDVTIYDENRQPVFDEKNNRLKASIKESDFVGGLVISPAANRAESFFKTIEQQKPGIRTAVGGPHVAGYEQAEYFANFTDSVVQGESESTIKEVVEGKEGIIQGKPIQDLDELPIPNLDLIDTYYRKLGLEHIYPKSVPISTSRGCPRDCEFCAVSNIHGQKIRRRSLDRIVEELDERIKIGEERGQRRGMFFADDNFSINPGQRIKLLQEMASRDYSEKLTGISVQDEVPGLLEGGEEYMDLMKEAGITTVMLGVESFEEESLGDINKSHKPEEAEKAIRMLKDRGINVYSFSLANPAVDTRESIRRHLDKLKELGVEVAQMTIETPIPGTSLWEEMKDKLITHNWTKWDFSHCVVEPLYGTARGFEKMVREEMKRFYSLWKASGQALRSLGEFLRGRTSEAERKARKSIITLWGNYAVSNLYS